MFGLAPNPNPNPTHHNTIPKHNVGTPPLKVMLGQPSDCGCRVACILQEWVAEHVAEVLPERQAQEVIPGSVDPDPEVVGDRVAP